jgi:hypothetical protein
MRAHLTPTPAWQRLPALAATACWVLAAASLAPGARAESGAAGNEAASQQCKTADPAPGPATAGKELEALCAPLSPLAAGVEIPGFKCEPFSAQTGLNCIGRVPGYPREVVMVIPPGFKPEKNPEIIVHLHGHNNTGYGPEHLLKRFGLASGLAQSGRNAILIAPHSKEKCEDFNRYFSAKKPEAFEHLVGRSLDALKSAQVIDADAKPGPITLTAHSGGYVAAADILKSGAFASSPKGSDQATPQKIREVLLFDATYGAKKPPVFTKFASNKNNRLWIAYQPGTATARGAARIKLQKGAFRSSSRLAPNSAALTEALRSNRQGAFPAHLGKPGDTRAKIHNDIFLEYFPVFLKGR